MKFVTATSEKIVGIEKIPEKAQKRPCVVAFQSQQPVAVADIEQAAEWPEYIETALELGLKAAVGYPLSYQDTWLGALNIYADERRQWSENDLDVLESSPTWQPHFWFAMRNWPRAGTWPDNSRAPWTVGYLRRCRLRTSPALQPGEGHQAHRHLCGCGGTRVEDT